MARFMVSQVRVRTEESAASFEETRFLGRMSKKKKERKKQFYKKGKEKTATNKQVGFISPNGQDDGHVWPSWPARLPPLTSCGLCGQVACFRTGRDRSGSFLRALPLALYVLVRRVKCMYTHNTHTDGLVKKTVQRRSRRREMYLARQES